MTILMDDWLIILFISSFIEDSDNVFHRDIPG